MSQIIVQSSQVVLVDGQNYGKVCDTIANNPKLASDVQIALEAWVAGEAEKLSVITADRDRIAKLLADASAAFDAGDVATLAAMRAASLQTETEKKLAAALAKKAEAEAEIAALTE
jgi:hypothetical protein